MDDVTNSSAPPRGSVTGLLEPPPAAGTTSGSSRATPRSGTHRARATGRRDPVSGGGHQHTRGHDTALFAAIYAAVGVGIFETDLEHRIVRCNDAFAAMLGMPVHQIVGRPGWDFFHPDSPPADPAAVDVLTTGRRATYAPTRLLTGADGSPLTVKMNWAVIGDDTGQAVEFVCVVTDISDQDTPVLRHQAPADSAPADPAPADRDHARATLLATVSHDLRNPITAIKGFAELLADADDATDRATRAHYAHRIQSRADYLATLLDGLSDHTTPDTSPVSLEPICLSRLARTCADNLGPVLGRHPIQVQGSDALAMADPIAMTRIFDNLLSNAAKYSPAGSPLTITIDHSDTHVRVAVTDHGRGISAEDIDTIFEPFHRGRLAQDDGGTGLGLANVRHLATRQGGRAWITSTLGHGTTVTVQLTRAAAVPAAVWE